MEKISVIVPVYNVEQYLRRCLDSILNQSYKNLEIIIVNDGSPDNCGSICDEYKAKDYRIRVIHKKNGGLSSARNAGLEIATGEYIGFVDSDDFITKDMYEHLYNILIKTKSDISSVKAQVTQPNQEIKQKLRNYDLTEYDSREELLEGYLEEGEFSCCVNLYKHTLFTGINFPEGKINEDIATNFKLFSNANKMVRSNKVCYIYYKNNGSITTSGFKKKDYDLKDACDELYNMAKKEQYGRIEYLAKARRYRVDFSLLCKIAVYGIDDDTLDKNLEVKKLLRRLRKNYIFLLNSPLGLMRKIVLTIIFLNFSMLEYILKIHKLLRRH